MFWAYLEPTHLPQKTSVFLYTHLKIFFENPPTYFVLKKFGAFRNWHIFLAFFQKIQYFPCSMLKNYLMLYPQPWYSLTDIVIILKKDTFITRNIFHNPRNLVLLQCCHSIVVSYWWPRPIWQNRSEKFITNTTAASKYRPRININWNPPPPFPTKIYFVKVCTSKIHAISSYKPYVRKWLVFLMRNELSPYHLSNNKTI